MAMKTYVALIVTFVLGISIQAFAEKPSCDELREIGADIAYVSSYLSNGTIDKITEGSEEDKTLRDLVDGLKMLSSLEDDSELSANVKALDKAWHDMDSNAFVKSLNKTKVSYDRLYKKDCR